jgi:hypothetical protein
LGRLDFVLYSSILEEYFSLPPFMIDGSVIIRERIGSNMQAVYEAGVFYDLLSQSLSLEYDQKKTIIDMMPSLSQWQIDELIDTFTQERREYIEVYHSDSEVIQGFVDRQRRDWALLVEHYAHMQMLERQNIREQMEIDRLRAGLLMDDEPQETTNS